jgi:hypothetical protein
MFGERKEKKKVKNFWSFMLPRYGTRMFFFFSLTCVKGGDGGHRGCYCAGALGAR